MNVKVPLSEAEINLATEALNHFKNRLQHADGRSDRLAHKVASRIVQRDIDTLLTKLGNARNTIIANAD